MLAFRSWRGVSDECSTPNFPDSFKREAVDRVANSGLSVGFVARELGLHETVLRRWMAQFGVQATGQNGLGTSRAPQRRRRPRRRRIWPQRRSLIHPTRNGASAPAKRLVENWMTAMALARTFPGAMASARPKVGGSQAPSITPIANMLAMAICGVAPCSIAKPRGVATRATPDAIQRWEARTGKTPARRSTRPEPRLQRRSTRTRS